MSHALPVFQAKKDQGHVIEEMYICISINSKISSLDLYTYPETAPAIHEIHDFSTCVYDLLLIYAI